VVATDPMNLFYTPLPHHNLKKTIALYALSCDEYKTAEHKNKKNGAC